MRRLCYIVKCGCGIWPHPHCPIQINHKSGKAVEWHSQWWLCLAGNTIHSEGSLRRRTSNIHPTNDMPCSGRSNGQIFQRNAARPAGESSGKNVCACVKTIEGVYIVKKKKKKRGPRIRHWHFPAIRMYACVVEPAIWHCQWHGPIHSVKAQQKKKIIWENLAWMCNGCSRTCVCANLRYGKWVRRRCLKIK